jgi:hypothetical protein
MRIIGKHNDSGEKRPEDVKSNRKGGRRITILPEIKLTALDRFR